MVSKKSKKTFWPYGIVLSIIACIIACIATIVISLDYPVEMDNFYLSKYQKVDQDINEILKQQAEFEKKFGVKLLKNELKLNRENIIEILVDKKDISSSNPTPKILLTRPDTNSYNLDLNSSYYGDTLKTQAFIPTLVGRWQVMVKFQDVNTTGFYKFELFAGE